MQKEYAFVLAEFLGLPVHNVLTQNPNSNVIQPLILMVERWGYN